MRKWEITLSAFRKQSLILPRAPQTSEYLVNSSSTKERFQRERISSWRSWTRACNTVSRSESHCSIPSPAALPFLPCARGKAWLFNRLRSKILDWKRNNKIQHLKLIYNICPQITKYLFIPDKLTHETIALASWYIYIHTTYTQKHPHIVWHLLRIPPHCSWGGQKFFRSWQIDCGWGLTAVQYISTTLPRLPT